MTRRLQGHDLIDFRNAIIENFDPPKFDELLLGINVRITDKVNPEGGGMEEVVLTIIKRAEEQGWLLNLIEAAYEQRPDDLRFKRIYEEFQPLIEGLNEDPCDALVLHGGATMIDRKGLRQELCALRRDERRILVVQGERLSGKTYSRQLIAHLKKHTGAFEAVWCDLEKLSKWSENGQVTPQLIAEELAEQMSLDMPTLGQEQEARWINRFCNSLAKQLDDRNIDYWIFIDHFGKVLLTQGSEDLILQLASRIQFEMTRLRLILVEYKEVEELRANLDLPFGFENIPKIQQQDLTNDLTDVFFEAYRNRKRRKQVDFTADDIAQSIAKVWQAVNTGQGGWLRTLSQAIDDELKGLSNEVR